MMSSSSPKGAPPIPRKASDPAHPPSEAVIKVNMRGLSNEILAGPWLLWVAFGLSASLSSAGFHWIIPQIAGASFVIAWMVGNVELRTIVRSMLFTVLEVFFKNFDVAGEARVPATGPVIFVCAPHANQFLDGLVVLKAVGRTDLGFLTAAKTMRRKYVGKIATAMGAIPVERAQDLAKPGRGEVSVVGTKVTGHGTAFTSTFKPKDGLVLASGEYKKAHGRVAEVLSDTELVLKEPLKTKTGTSGGAQAYKVQPYINQMAMFNGVFDRLKAGGAVGIFPEGGSHDRTSLLPLKAGVSMMALGAMDKYRAEGLKVTVVPVGINYFLGHRFRSRVFVDIGQPFVPAMDMVDAYAQGGALKHSACNALLDQISVAINAVTIQAPDYEILQFFRTMRRMYKPVGQTLNALQRFNLMKTFSEGYSDVKDERDVKRLFEEVERYRDQLRQQGVPDHKVETAAARARKSGLLGGSRSSGNLSGMGGRSGSSSNLKGSSGNLAALAQAAATGIKGGLKRVVSEDNLEAITASLSRQQNYYRGYGLVAYRCALLLFYISVAVPGTIMAYPMLIMTTTISARKARQAVAASSVKLAGRDVLATWKVLVSLVMVPTMHLTYTFLAWAVWSETAAVVWFFFAPFVAMGSILATERGTKLAISIRALVQSLRNEQDGKELIKTRDQLQHRVREVVKKYSWDRDLQVSEPRLYRRFTLAPEDMEVLEELDEGPFSGDDAGDAKQ